MGKLTIGFQGEHGAYSEEAIYKQFGRDVKTVPTVSIHEVFNLTEAGAVDLGVVPVENSVEGSINETYDMLLSSNLKVIGEVVLRVVHCLIALRTAKLGGLKVVYSHPQALAQCRNFVTSMGLEPIVTYDTAGSVKMIKEKRLEGAAAIAGERAAEIYGLRVIKKGIEDYSTNSTRFLIVSREGSREPDRARGGAIRRGGISRGSKTSLIFAVPHEPGSLYNALEVFARAKINLTKIESRPTKERPWEYYFFVDFEGRSHDPKVVEVLSELAKKTAFLKVLGSYPRSKADRS
ncbi:MAG TPA: prephenate dehydratase [Nitrososphaerales archaeon]|nr:prephenate dehydratase [Nitrososphaerales archaeon]